MKLNKQVDMPQMTKKIKKYSVVTTLLLAGTLAYGYIKQHNKLHNEIASGRVKTYPLDDNLIDIANLVGYSKHIHNFGDSSLLFDNVHKASSRRLTKKLLSSLPTLGNNNDYNLASLITIGIGKNSYGYYPAALVTNTVDRNALQKSIGPYTVHDIQTLYAILTALLYLEKVEETQYNNTFDIIAQSGKRPEDYNGNLMGIVTYIQSIHQKNSLIDLFHKVKNHIMDDNQSGNNSVVAKMHAFISDYIGIHMITLEKDTAK